MSVPSSFRAILGMFNYYGCEKYDRTINNLDKERSGEFSVLQMTRFFHLLKTDVIEEFLKFDRCYKLADKYLLTMVFVYFVRAKLPISQYTRSNFFAALCLAHDIEEDDEELKWCFVDWAFPANYDKTIDDLLKLRDKIWKDMGFRACVSLKTCHEVMEIMNQFESSRSLSERVREPAHGGAARINHKKLEKCKHCYDLQDKQRFYWSDFDTSPDTDTDSEGSDLEETLFGKRMRIDHEE